MKRFWIGLGLLGIILVAGLWTSRRLGDIHSAIAEDLRQSAAAARMDNWEQADRLAEQAEKRWEDNWSFTAALADHTVLDEIDGLLAQAEVCRQGRDPIAYAAVCARVSRYIDAVQESHRLNWRNLL